MGGKIIGMDRQSLIKDWEDFYVEESLNYKEKRENCWNLSHIIDENQSIKWNKEQIIQHNKEIEENYKNKCINLFERKRVLKFKTFRYFKDEVYNDDTRLNQSMFEIAWAKGYDEGHAEGIYRILDEVEEYLDFFFDMLDQYNNKM